MAPPDPELLLPLLLAAAAGEVFVAPAMMELRVAFPLVELLLVEVLLPGPTKKNVAPRRVRFPVSAANFVKLKFDRFVGTEPGVTLTVVEVWRYMATT